MNIDKDIANLLILLIIVVIAYFSIWLFNHINAWLVIPDAERLDIGSNKIIAVFQHRHQAEEWAKSMWEKFYLIEEVQSEHFS